MPLVLIGLVNPPVYAAGEGNHQIQSFAHAKRILIREIYRGHQKTFYCGSQYTRHEDWSGSILYPWNLSENDLLNGATEIPNASIVAAHHLKV